MEPPANPGRFKGLIDYYAARDRVTGQPVRDAALEGLSAAVKLLRTEAGNLVSMEAALKADRSRTYDDVLVQGSAAALKTAERVAPRLDAARAAVQAELALIERRISQPPPPASPTSLAMEREIRDRLAAMDDKRRAAVLAAAKANDDLQVIGAVLRGPAWMSGLSDINHTSVRHAYQSKHHAADVDRKGRLTQALSASERAGTAFVSFVRGFSESEAARIAASNADRAREALTAQLSQEAE